MIYIASATRNFMEFLMCACLGMGATVSCMASQPAITCSKLTVETGEQGVKCVQS